MKPVIELFKKRKAEIYFVGPEDSVLDALQVLARHEVGALMVMKEGRLIGVLSERDYTRKIALQGRSSKDTLVREIMTANVISVTPQTRTRDCMSLMSAKRIRHLPVTDGETIIGMISIRDIMDDIIADHEFTISQLEQYINS